MRLTYTLPIGDQQHLTPKKKARKKSSYDTFVCLSPRGLLTEAVLAVWPASPAVCTKCCSSYTSWCENIFRNVNRAAQTSRGAQRALETLRSLMPSCVIKVYICAFRVLAFGLAGGGRRYIGGHRRPGSHFVLYSLHGLLFICVCVVFVPLRLACLLF